MIKNFQDQEHIKLDLNFQMYHNIYKILVGKN